MQPFAPGDRVVAINTDMSGPVLSPPDVALHSFSFPDGPLRRDRIYHIEAVQTLRDGTQGVFLTGMRVLYGAQNMSWHHTRFRKMDTLKDHVPEKRRRRVPVKMARRDTRRLCVACTNQ